MFRQITLTIVPAAILALMVCAVDSSASSAFAKGGPAGKFGKGLHNNMHNHRDFHNRYFGRYYDWRYRYGFAIPRLCSGVRAGGSRGRRGARPGLHDLCTDLR